MEAAGFSAPPPRARAPAATCLARLPGKKLQPGTCGFGLSGMQVSTSGGNMPAGGVGGRDTQRSPQPRSTGTSLGGRLQGRTPVWSPWSARQAEPLRPGSRPSGMSSTRHGVWDPAVATVGLAADAPGQRSLQAWEDGPGPSRPRGRTHQQPSSLRREPGGGGRRGPLPQPESSAGGEPALPGPREGRPAVVPAAVRRALRGQRPGLTPQPEPRLHLPSPPCPGARSGRLCTCAEALPGPGQG